MRAMVLKHPAPVETAPLELRNVAVPEPAANEIRLRVEACGICRTDLHVVEGELAPQLEGVIPGHQVVGTVESCGSLARRFRVGERVGVAWLRSTCGECRYCRAGSENLCPQARFTGYHAHGGYAEYAVVREDFAYAVPSNLSAAEITPLLCAGIIGYRALRQAEVQPGCRVGLYGFGSSAHIAIQVARHWGCTVYVMTRGEGHQQLARDMGAAWAGTADASPPDKLDSAILFAPAGELVLPALEALEQGGTLAVAGIYLSDIPALNYEHHLFHEKTLRSVTANTRQDGEDLLRVAAEIPIHPRTTTFPLADANRALQQLKSDGIQGSGVLLLV